jgi:glutathione S-transferase
MSTAVATPGLNTATPNAPALHVHVSRFIRAPRERVFAAWTEAEQMQRWMGPPNFTCIETESDLRAGGRYRVVMRGTPPPRDGQPSQEITSTVTGEYFEVRPPEFVRYSWNPTWSPGEQSVVTLRLSEENGGTRLELVHEGFATIESANGHNQGWNGVLDKFATYIER